jgi:hypothetical protein
MNLSMYPTSDISCHVYVVRLYTGFGVIIGFFGLETAHDYTLDYTHTRTLPRTRTRTRETPAVL